MFSSWIRGYYRFENESFEQIAKYFERVYGKEIYFEDKNLKNLKLTGTFLYEQQIETVLEIFNMLLDFQYQITENKVTIY